MDGVDCEWLRAAVIASLQMLAAPASTQTEYIRSSGLHHDELALELDDVLGAFLGNCQPSKTASLALRALDRQLDKMSGQGNASLWTDEALPNAEEWMTVRRFAKRSLAELNETPSSPADLAVRARRGPLLTSREAAVYGLVLRHMAEVGHGWESASPLRGFYVLNRLINGVEDPSFNPITFEDEKTGTPLSRELMHSLASSLQEVTEIEFVPTFLDLIDLQSAQVIHVRNSRGLIALGPIRKSERHLAVGAYFHAGPRWSRSNRYELVERDGSWGITRFYNLMVS